MNEKLVMIGAAFVIAYFAIAFCVVAYRMIRKLLRILPPSSSDTAALVVTAFAFCLPIAGIAHAGPVSMVGFSDQTFLGTAGPFEMADGCRTTFGEDLLRVCTVEEVVFTPSPPVLDADASGWINPIDSDYKSAACSGWARQSSSKGTTVTGAGLFVSTNCAEERPAACCVEQKPARWRKR